MKEIPILQGKPADKAIFNPADFVKYTRILRLGQFTKVPEFCIISYEQSCVDIILKTYKTKKIRWSNSKAPLYKFRERGVDVGIVSFGIGASFAGTVLEELIAMGMKYFITIGSCGSLQKSLKTGGIIISEKAIRDEGTSYHYLKPSKYAESSPMVNKYLELAMKNKKMKYSKGTTWTTDAPYRETVNKVKKYQKEGVLAVEMEASALFAIAAFRKVELGVLLFVSDSLAGLKWSPQFHHPASLLAKKKLLRTALDAFVLLEQELE